MRPAPRGFCFQPSQPRHDAGRDELGRSFKKRQGCPRQAIGIRDQEEALLHRATRPGSPGNALEPNRDAPARFYIFDLLHPTSDPRATPGNALEPNRDAPARFYIFDLLHLDGYDLTGAGVLDRKELLRQVLARVPPPLCFNDHVVGSGPGHKTGKSCSASGLAHCAWLVILRGPRKHPGSGGRWFAG
jgi:hypothetical protein